MKMMVRMGQEVDIAADLLKKNELVGMPTETVYGLAGNALSEDALLKIFEVKKRPQFDPIIAHVASIHHVESLALHLPTMLRPLAEQLWPGPLTLLLQKKNHVPDLLTSGLNRVAVRVPAHALAQQLLNAVTFPIAAPSANPFGYISPTTAQHVKKQLGNKIGYILDGGASTVGLESTIVGTEEGKMVIYRLGGITKEEIEELTKTPVQLQVNQSSNPSAPGMLKSHYSPNKKLIIGNLVTLLEKVSEPFGLISFQKDYGVKNQIILSKSGSLREAGTHLFSALRAADEMDVSVILTEYVPDEGLGLAINDRLRRATVYSD